MQHFDQFNPFIDHCDGNRYRIIARSDSDGWLGRDAELVMETGWTCSRNFGMDMHNPQLTLGHHQRINLSTSSLDSWRRWYEINYDKYHPASHAITMSIMNNSQMPIKSSQLGQVYPNDWINALLITSLFIFGNWFNCSFDPSIDKRFVTLASVIEI